MTETWDTAEELKVDAFIDEFKDSAEWKELNKSPFKWPHTFAAMACYAYAERELNALRLSEAKLRTERDELLQRVDHFSKAEAALAGEEG